MRCPRCSTENRSSAVFCKKCGFGFDSGPSPQSASPAPADNRCSRCGEDLSPKATYCRNCGSVIAKKATSPDLLRPGSPGTSLKIPVIAGLGIIGLVFILVVVYIFTIAASGSAAQVPAGEFADVFPSVTSSATAIESPYGSPFAGHGYTLAISESGSGFSQVKFSVVLATGSPPVDFGEVMVRINTDTGVETLAPATPLRTESVPSGQWSVSRVTGDTGNSDNVLDHGEVFTLSVKPGQQLAVNSRVTLSLELPGKPAFMITRTMPAHAKSGENVIY